MRTETDRVEEAQPAEAGLAAGIGCKLRGRAMTVATAESCTGGLVGHRLTAVSGSSAYFVGGVTAYANRVKTSLLGVDPALIEAQGAVSEAVALAMAAGARRVLAADWAVSVTGVAGPSGGTAAKPVGLVYVGVAGPGAAALAEEHRFEGEREAVRQAACDAALGLLDRCLTQQGGVEHGQEDR